MKTKFDKLVSLIADYETFKFCGPSDDPDLQTSVIYSFKHLLSNILHYSNYLENKALKSQLEGIDLDFNDIYSVYDINSKLSPILEDIKDYISTTNIDDNQLDALERLTLIDTIAGELQERMVTSDINVFLSSYKIKFEKEPIASSKRVYVKNILAECSNKIILSIASDLKIPYKNNIIQSTKIDSISSIDFIEISDQIQKCHLKIQNNDYTGAITSSRALVESVCIYIIENSNKSYNSDGKLNKLYNEASKILRMNPKEYNDNSIKQICSGFFSIINGLANLRNDLGDAHGKSQQNSYKPAYRHALLAVNSAKTISEFLYSSWVEKDNAKII